MNKGIFWVVNDELLCVKVECDMNGTPQEFVKFSAKSGDNFNHKADGQSLTEK